MKGIKYYIRMKEMYQKTGNWQGVKFMDEAIEELNKKNGQVTLK